MNLRFQILIGIYVLVILIIGGLQASQRPDLPQVVSARGPFSRSMSLGRVFTSQQAQATPAATETAVTTPTPETIPQTGVSGNAIRWAVAVLAAALWIMVMRQFWKEVHPE
ncbi:MAG: hypothetical protein EHM70_15105 [Chloroflexota bacterium]|nr:MAG: hypothetical protein EHM70_15105 [Chloroflexota bacterium]